jgi:hypothetical protein
MLPRMLQAATIPGMTRALEVTKEAIASRGPADRPDLPVDIDATMRVCAIKYGATFPLYN